MMTSAITALSPRQIAIGDVEIPEPIGDELLVETLLSGISPGTELRNISGGMEGVSFPFVPGYLNIGRVVGRARGSRVDIPDGTIVFSGGTQRCGINRAYGGHIAHAVTADVFPLADGVAIEDAILTKLCAIAYQGTRLSRPTPEDTAAVIGLGPIGQFSLRLHTLQGCRAIGFDLSAERVELARKAGSEAYVIAGSLPEMAAKLQPAGFDIVVDATGVPAVLKDSISLLRDRPWQESPLVPGVRLLIQGSYTGQISVNYQQLFMKGASVHLPRDSQRTDVQACLRLIERGLLHPRDLVSEIAPPSSAAAIYDRLAYAKGAYMTAAFDWRCR